MGTERNGLFLDHEGDDVQVESQAMSHRIASTSQGNSSCHAMQWRLDRRFAHRFQVTTSYTWSRNIDSTSVGVGTINNQEAGSNRTSIPLAQGGLKLDRGPSDYDRTHRFTIAYIWDVPGLAHGILRRALGGWSVSGITTFQSGAPFTVSNGVARNNYAMGGAVLISAMRVRPSTAVPS